MKNKDLFELRNNLKEVESLKGKSENRVKFAYAIARNLDFIESEIKILEKASTPSEKYMEYQNERRQLLLSYSEKDEKGSPVTTDAGNGLINFKIGEETKEEFEDKMNELAKKYKKEIDSYASVIEDYKKLLEEEADIKIYKFKLEYIPEDITGEQMAKIFKFVEE